MIQLLKQEEIVPKETIGQLFKRLNNLSTETLHKLMIKMIDDESNPEYDKLTKSNPEQKNRIKKYRENLTNKIEEIADIFIERGVYPKDTKE